MSPVPDHPTVTTLEGAFGQIESEGPQEHDGTLQVLVNFENGERVWVPAERLILQEDGNFQLTVSLAELAGQHTRPTLAARPEALDALLAGAGGAAPHQAAPSAPPVTERTAPVAEAPLAPAYGEALRPAVDAEAEDELEQPHFPAPTEPLPEAPEAGLDHVRVSRVVEAVREDVGASLLREEVDIHRVPVNEYVQEAPPIRYEDDRIIIPVLEEVLHVEKRLLVKEEVVITKRRTQVAAERRELRETTHVVAAPDQANDTTRDGDRARDGLDSYRQHYDQQRHPGAHGFAYYEPAYRFGALLQSAARYRGWTWDQLEPEARALWERDNPGTWTQVQPAVRFAWSETG